MTLSRNQSRQPYQFPFPQQSQMLSRTAPTFRTQSQEIQQGARRQPSNAVPDRPNLPYSPVERRQPEALIPPAQEEEEVSENAEESHGWSDSEEERNREREEQIPAQNPFIKSLRNFQSIRNRMDIEGEQYEERFPDSPRYVPSWARSPQEANNDHPDRYERRRHYPEQS